MTLEHICTPNSLRTLADYRWYIYTHGHPDVAVTYDTLNDIIAKQSLLLNNYIVMHYWRHMNWRQLGDCIGHCTAIYDFMVPQLEYAFGILNRIEMQHILQRLHAPSVDAVMASKSTLQAIRRRNLMHALYTNAAVRENAAYKETIGGQLFAGVVVIPAATNRVPFGGLDAEEKIKN